MKFIYDAQYTSLIHSAHFIFFPLLTHLVSEMNDEIIDFWFS